MESFSESGRGLRTKPIIIMNDNMTMIDEDAITLRFWLIAALGGSCATFGILANALLTKLFISRLRFRHSPFFFLGFVALFDTLLDTIYIVISTLPLLSEYFEIIWLYPFLTRNFWCFYLLGQIFKISSVFCLVVASFERYLISSHWTFSGFDYQSRWIILAIVIIAAIVIRFVISLDIIITMNHPVVGHKPLQQRTYIQELSRKEWFTNFLDLITVIVPFGTLVFLNGGIVIMVKQQNVQQLRSLLTELTMGPDFTKIRRRNIRDATNTMLLIISIYLISNLLGLFLSIIEYISPGFLQKNYPCHYYLGYDCASLLNVFGNALRFPAHYFSNAEVREQFRQMMYCMKLPTTPVERIDKLRRYSGKLDATALYSPAPVTSCSCTTNCTIVENGSMFSSSKNNDHSRTTISNSSIQNDKFYPNHNKNTTKYGGCVGAYCNTCGSMNWDCCCDGLLITVREPFFDDHFKANKSEKERDNEQDLLPLEIYLSDI